MAKKKPMTRKKTANKKKRVVKKVTRPTSKKKSVAKKPTRKRKKRAAAPEVRSAAPSTLSGRIFRRGPGQPGRGVGSAAAGQSGDLQGLSRRTRADSESVEELVEEGQFYEAEAVAAVENALDPDQGEVQTHEVPEDDVPEEYLDEDH
jgi:hypothetical protein